MFLKVVNIIAAIMAKADRAIVPAPLECRPDGVRTVSREDSDDRELRVVRVLLCQYSGTLSPVASTVIVPGLAPLPTETLVRRP